MHMQHAAQIRLKEETLVDQLQRIGKLEIEVDARRPTDHSRSTGTRSGGIDEADDARSSISHCNSGSTLHRHIDANSSVLQPAIVNRSLPVLSAAAPSDASSCFALSVEGGGTDGHDGDSSTFGYRSRARLSGTYIFSFYMVLSSHSCILCAYVAVQMCVRVILLRIEKMLLL